MSDWGRDLLKEVEHMSLKGVSVPRTFLFSPLLPGYGEVSSSVLPTLPQWCSDYHRPKAVKMGLEPLKL